MQKLNKANLLKGANNIVSSIWFPENFCLGSTSIEYVSQGEYGTLLTCLMRAHAIISKAMESCAVNFETLELLLYAMSLTLWMGHRNAKKQSCLTLGC